MRMEPPSVAPRSPAVSISSLEGGEPFGVGAIGRSSPSLILWGLEGWRAGESLYPRPVALVPRGAHRGNKQ